MRLIIVSISKAIINLSYIIAIILMFILIFILLGMFLLSGNPHYQSFLEAFSATYQILALESWNELLIEIWPMNYSKRLKYKSSTIFRMFFQRK